MPKIIQRAGGGRIIFDADDFVNGLSPNYSISSLQNQRGMNYLAQSQGVNPFRSYGYAYPGYLPTDVTSVSEVTDYCRKGLVDGTYAYIITNGAKIHKLNLNTNTLVGSFYTMTGHGGHSTPIANDSALYSTRDSDGAILKKFFYSWSDTTDWDVGVYDLSGTFTDNFMSARPATQLSAPYLTKGAGYPHPLIVGDDDVLYIGDRNFIHAYDIKNTATDSDGKFHSAVLTLPSGYVISSFAKIPNGLMVFTYQENSVTSADSSYYKGEARAWEWNYVDLDITASYDLNDNFVTEAFNYLGTVGCFTSGRPQQEDAGRKLDKMQLFDGTRFKAVQIFKEGVPIRGGVEVIGDVIYWNAAGNLLSYGSPILGVKSGLNKLAVGGGVNSGMFSTFTSIYQYMSSGATTAGGLQIIGDNYYGSAIMSTTLAEPSFPPGQFGRITNVKVRFAKTTTSANSRALTVNLRNRWSTSCTVIDSITDIADNRGISVHRTKDILGAEFITFDALKLILQWTAGLGSTDAPGVASVEVDYENVNV